MPEHPLGPPEISAFDWLALRRDVLIVGDDGSGKTGALRRIAEGARERGLTAIRISASRLPGSTSLAPFRTHGLLVKRRAVQLSESDLLGAFVEELGGRRGLLLVDDIDALDDDSFHLLNRLLMSSPALLAATTVPRGPGDAPLLTALLGVRAPAHVAIPPLDVAGMSKLVSGYLDGPVNLAFVGRILAATAGNPKAAIAVLDACVRNGGVTMVDRMWTDSRALLDAPLDPILHMLTGRLPHDDVVALRRLAPLTPLSFDEANRLAGADTVERLRIAGRLVSASAVGDPLLAVSPPALQAALHRPSRPTGSVEDLLRRVQDIAPFVDVALDARSGARAAWTKKPSVASAVELLQSLGEDTDPAEIVRVFDRTQPSEGDSTDDLLRFALLGAGASPEASRAIARLEFAHSERDTLRRVEAWRASGVVEPRLPVDSDAGPLMQRAEAALLLESGRVTAALELAAEALSGTDDPHGRAELELLIVDAHVLLNELDTAADCARHFVEQALEERSTILLVPALFSLAEVLWFTGRSMSAWRTLAAALSFSSAGPFNRVHPRLLTLGAVLLTEQGETELARVFATSAVGASTALGAQVEAVAALAARLVGDPEDTVERFWSTGRRLLARGAHIAGISVWLSAGPLTPAQAEQLRHALEGVSAPLLRRVARVRLLLDAGSDREILQALADIKPLPASLHDAVTAAVERAERALGLASATPSRRDQTGVAIVRRDLSIAGPELGLSLRERQIAELASRGLSNKQIAEQLGLSVRTVENHMYRLMNKLGLNRRHDLASRWSAGIG